MKTESWLVITRLQTTVTRLRNLDNASDNTFKEFVMLLNRKLRCIISQTLHGQWSLVLLKLIL